MNPRKFDYAAARQDGVSDAEIAEFLAQQQGFDLNAARKDGVSDYAVISFLSEAPGVDYKSAPNESGAETKRNQRDNRRVAQSTTGGKVIKALDDTVRGVADVVTLGFADEIAAKMDTLTGRSDNYEEALASERVKDDQGGGFRMAGQVAGSFVPVLGQLGRGKAAATGLSQVGAGTVGKTVLTGAASGATYGAGSSEETEGGRIFNDALGGAALGGALGGLGGVAGAAINRVQRSQVAKTLPTVEALKANASASYKAADDLGVSIKPLPLFNAMDEAKSKLASKGIGPNSPLVEHQQVFQAIKGVEDLIGTKRVSWQGLEQGRRSLSAIARGSSSPEVRKLVGEVIDTLDDKLQGLKPTDYIGPGKDKAGQALKLTADARKQWKQVTKADVLESLILRAEDMVEFGAKSSLTDAYRSQVKQFMLSKRAKLFTPEERALIQKAMSQGAGDKLLNLIEAFNTGGKIGGLASLGAAVGTSGASAAVQGAGALGSKLRDSATSSGARMLSREIGAGQRAAPIYSADQASLFGLGAGLMAGEYASQ